MSQLHCTEDQKFGPECLFQSVRLVFVKVSLVKHLRPEVKGGLCCGHKYLLSGTDMLEKFC